VSTSTRWLAAVAAAIALIVALAVAATMVAGGERTFQEGTPERTVQRYLAAVADRDATAAASFLSTELAQRCDSFVQDMITNRGSGTIRATLDETVLRDGGAVQVRVQLTEAYGGGPFDSGESARPVMFDLTQEDGNWRFTPAPWPMYCPLAPVK
jgi:hypothetical protein